MVHLVDCHTHSWYSSDARCNISELCQAARDRGLAAVAVTDHFDYGPKGESDADFDKRKTQRAWELAQVQQHWQGKLEVLRGIEIGQPHWNVPAATALANCGDFDLVIGSIHDLRPGKSIYRAYDLTNPENCDALYAQFLQEAQEMLRVCDFDVFGHYDYPLRVMEAGGVSTDMLRWKEPMLDFLKALAQSGVSLEVNTCGLRRWMQGVGGQDWVLEAFRSVGGKRVTIGSDAHFTRHVGLGVQEVCTLLRKNGFDKVTVYRQRKPVELSIG